MEPLTVAEYEAPAQARLPTDVWDFLAGGSGSESLLRTAREALDRVRLRPSVLVDVTRCDPATTVLGSALALPLGVAPMAYHRLCHPQGELATARAAGEQGALFIAAMFASHTLEEIAEAGSGPRWLQLYWLRRREPLLDLVRRAELAGYGALVLTVDAPRVARRLRDQRNSFTLPEHIRAVNLDPALMAATHGHRPGDSAVARHSREQFDASITWSDLAWLREQTSLPLVLKGVLTAEDARRAVAHGMAGIVVSNHGGRQLDHAVPGVEVLAEIVDAVAGQCAVLVDGGIRTGIDLLKVLALGADAALLGRPVLWGLTCGGQAGAAAVLGLLREELTEAMELCGRPTIDALDRTLLAESRSPKAEFGV
ncbi:4-hydroxymandelate oxidase [Kitasatospora sp. MAP12-15]|uniref:alpha-hydroxy acid oxidase n=1 Tax=unclassified Kitasatospora TaxID=2633591 RepID=UPI002472EFC1|nr:alpha-hydroxy acid oxidase [Kitasatospora sp. MAP12-44]MDH6109417.1 4-hydroxymandelate oxidase [Kitasatospora sp. MAP12-44]